MELRLVGVVGPLRQFGAVVRAEYGRDRVVVADQAVALENRLDDTLAILDELHPLYEVVVLPGRHVLEAANAPVESRWQRTDMNTVGLLDQADALGVDIGDELHITRDERVDTGDRVGDRGEFQGIEIGALSPVILVADMQRFNAGLERFQEKRAGTIACLEVRRVHLDDLGLFLAEFDRQVGIRRIEECLHGMAVDLPPFVDRGEERLDHGRRVLPEMAVHAPHHVIRGQWGSIVETHAFLNLEGVFGGVAVGRPFRRQFGVQGHVIEDLDQIVIGRPAADVIDARREDDRIHLIIRSMQGVRISDGSALARRRGQGTGRCQESSGSRCRESQGAHRRQKLPPAHEPIAKHPLNHFDFIHFDSSHRNFRDDSLNWARW